MSDVRQEQIAIDVAKRTQPKTSAAKVTWWQRREDESAETHVRRFYEEASALVPKLSHTRFGKTLGSLSHGPNQEHIREPGNRSSRHEEL